MNVVRSFLEYDSGIFRKRHGIGLERKTPILEFRVKSPPVINTISNKYSYSMEKLQEIWRLYEIFLLSFRKNYLLWGPKKVGLNNVDINTYFHKDILF